MFSQTRPSSKEVSAVLAPEKAAAEQTARERDGRLVAPSSQTSRNGSRTSSDTEKKRPGVLSSGSSGRSSKDNDICAGLKRFEILEDGSHEHHLKGIKRQEGLSGMLSNFLGGGKRRDDHLAAAAPIPTGNLAGSTADEPGLSLMSGWVDQFKQEREREQMGLDAKGGPSTAATLVEKYGRCQEIVGRGAFGTVRVAHKQDPNDSRRERLHAVKEFRRRPQESPKRYQKRLTSEFCISAALRHPNVIHTLDLLQDAKGEYCEVMEYCAGGDLYTLVLAAGKLEAVEADCFFKQLMRGVEYMHEMGVAHRDLKPENLLLTTHGALKISDFGNGECFRMAWESGVRMTAGVCGSAPYIAPEEYTEEEFDPRAVDVWATGVIYMAMRTGRHLWTAAKADGDDADEFYERYLEGRRDEAGYAPIESLNRVCAPCSYLFPFARPMGRISNDYSCRPGVAMSSTPSLTPILVDASPRHRCSSLSGAVRSSFAGPVKRASDAFSTNDVTAFP
jgi:protein-serine/threonine kinase